MLHVFDEFYGCDYPDTQIQFELLNPVFAQLPRSGQNKTNATPSIEVPVQSKLYFHILQNHLVAVKVTGS